jgi:hypothetical protein
MLAKIQNEGTLDRAVRVILGLALIAYAVFAHAPLGWFGLVPLATGVAGFCPFYYVLGFKTCAT